MKTYNKLSGMILFIALFPFTCLLSQIAFTEQDFLKQFQKIIKIADPAQINVKAEKLSQEDLRVSGNYGFNDLIKEAEKIYLPDDVSILNRNDPSIRSRIILDELRFRLLVAIQRQLEEKFHMRNSMDKAQDLILFTTANMEMSNIKTFLVKRQTALLKTLVDKEDKLRCWLSLKRMLIEIDLKASETGNRFVQRSPYGIEIQKGVFPKNLQNIAITEVDPEIKKFAIEAIDAIVNKGAKYKEMNSEIIIRSRFTKGIDKKAALFFEEAFKTKDPATKIDLYTKAIQQAPDFIVAYNNRAVCFLEAGNYSLALNDFTKVRDLDPYYESVNENIAVCYTNLNQTAKAVEFYTKAIENDRNNKRLYFNRGLRYYDLEIYDKAISDFTSALSFDTLLTHAYSNRAVCYYKEGNIDNAIQDYKIIIKLDPWNSAHYYNIGCLYWDKKDWKAVLQSWQQGLKLNPNDKNILANIDKIKAKLIK